MPRPRKNYDIAAPQSKAGEPTIAGPYIFKGRDCYHYNVLLQDPLTGKKRKLKACTYIKIDNPKGREKAIAVGQKILEYYRTNSNPNAPKRINAFYKSYLHNAELRELSPSYRSQIKASFEAFMKRYGEDVLLDRITLPMIRRFLLEMSSVSRARVFYACLRAAFEAAVQDGIIAVNPFAKFDLKTLPKREPRPRGILSPEQVVEIYTALPKESYLDRLVASFILFLFGSACRRAEGCYLLTTAINWENQSIGIAPTAKNKLKTLSSAGEIPMTKYAAIALREQALNKQNHPKADVRKSQWVFCNEKGEPYHPDSITKAAHKRLMAVCKQLGINSIGLDLHSMRHSISQLLIDGGVEISTTSKLLRHASLATTLTSYHRNADVATKFEAVMMVTGEMPMPASADDKSGTIIKHTLLILEFKRAA